MALVLKDRVREISTTSGTGPVTLDGAVSGYQSFATIGDGNVTYYVISSPATGAWEVGYGTYTAVGSTLSRDFVYASSNSNALVDFGSDPKDVLCTYPAEQAIYQETNGNLRLVGGVIGLTQDGTEGTTLPNTSFQAFTTGNYYMQANQQNLSSGAEASSDWVSTADNGTDTENYMNMGMASSGYNFPDFSAFKANSGYILSTGSDLRIVAGKFGAVTPGAQDIVFVAGSLKDTEERGRIAGLTGNWILDGLGAADTGEKLQVYGDFKATGAAAFGDTVTLHQDPTLALEAATKQYVDNAVAAGLTIHDPVRVEATTNLTATYNNGTAGVGATLTNAGTQTALVLDGVAVAVNDRVLIYLQTDATQNGVYTVTDIGSGSTNWVLTRATDADSYNPNDPDALEQGAYFYVQEGNTAAGESYVCNNVGTITFGTTPITFVQFSASPTFTGVDPIDVTGQTISLTGVVDPTHGGTGLSSFVVGDLLYSNATNTLTKLPIGTAGQALIVSGSTPAWGALNLAGAGVSGTLGATRGGTGQASYTTGDILYASATNTLTKLPGNTTTSKYFLSQTGTGSASQAPAWGAIAAGDVTGLAASATTDTTNAANITTGTLPSGRLIGGYTGVTAVGTLSSLSVNGTAVVSATSASDALRITQTGTGNALVVEDSTSPDSTPFVVDSSGYVIAGHTTRLTTIGTALVQGISSSFANTFASTRFSSTSSGSEINFAKSGSDTIGTNAVVANGDTLGSLSWAGADGTAYIRAASIFAQVDGTPGTNDMPGRLVFSTTADGASSSTERMRIDSAGNVGIGETNPQVKLHVQRTGPDFSPTFSADVVAAFVSGGVAGSGGAIAITTGNTATPFIYFGDTDDTDMGRIGYENASDAMTFRTNKIERIRIDSSGNVGIGTSSPAQPLDVVGNIQLTGSVLAPAGMAGAPSVTFSTDPDTGIYLSGTNQLGITTGGTQAAYFDASGNTNIVGSLGVKSATPSASAAINSSITVGPNATRYGMQNLLYLDNTQTLTADRSFYAAYNLAETQEQNDQAFSPNVYGSYNYARTSASAGNSLNGEGALYGAYNYALHQGADATFNRVENAYGTYTNVNASGATALIDQAYGVYSLVRPTNAGATIGTGYLFYGTLSTVTGTFNNRWGVYIASSINNYFAGGAQVGGTATGSTSAAGLGVGTAPTGAGNIDATGTITANAFVGDGSGLTGLGAFPAGTKILFAQTAAPTGWTKDTTHNNKALRVVSGTAGSGGSVAFTTAFANQAVSGTVGSTTLAESQIPSHTHNPRHYVSVKGGSNSPSNPPGVGGSTVTTTLATTATGGGGSHNHTFTGTAINLAVQYVDVIIATKD